MTLIVQGLGARVVGWTTLLWVIVPGAISAVGQEVAPADKSSYHLFRPTPRALMREMSTDRPDKTESAYTVDAGHVQLEADAVSYARDWRGGRGEPDSVRWAVANTNVKVGLANNLDAQLVLPLYERTRVERGDGGDNAVFEGFGDTTVRMKLNLWGNDSGPTALAVMPFVTFPTAADGLGADGVEGGVMVPLAIELPAGWGLGVMTQLDRARDADGGGYHFQWTNSATVGHAITDAAGGYAELFGSVDTEEPGDWEGSVDFGLTYAVSNDVQLDAGVNVGVTESAEDLVFFVGVSWRQ